VGNLAGKVALVTGAGGEHGIGRAVAMRLARDGADIAVNDITARPYDDASSGWSGVASVARDVEALGRRALVVVADISDAGAVDDMFAQATDVLGCVDILVSNAAARPGADRVPVVDLDEAAWDDAFKVNARGTFLCCRAAARRMIHGGDGGRIICIASTLGLRGRARYAAYSASKHAVVGLMECLALELAEDGITVNAICPGVVDTERVAHIAAAAPEEFVRARAVGNPMGRIGTPEDVANVAAFLASDESSYLTGQALTVTGGAHLAGPDYTRA
jgi:NAD(P)-dependent dehydrogenase (short-subunit alcohol dehydrogenase family)